MGGTEVRFHGVGGVRVLRERRGAYCVERVTALQGRVQTGPWPLYGSAWHQCATFCFVRATYVIHSNNNKEQEEEMRHGSTVYCGGTERVHGRGKFTGGRARNRRQGAGRIEKCKNAMGPDGNGNGNAQSTNISQVDTVVHLGSGAQGLVRQWAVSGLLWAVHGLVPAPG